MELNGLAALEQVVVKKLLAGDHPVLTALRQQAASAVTVSREHTGVGFYSSFKVTVPPLVGPQGFELTDVYARIPGLEHGAGFALFVRQGRMAWLEGYTYEGPWPAALDKFELVYQKEPRELTFA